MCLVLESVAGVWVWVSIDACCYVEFGVLGVKGLELKMKNPKKEFKNVNFSPVLRQRHDEHRKIF